jgi:hypothetical protein
MKKILLISGILITVLLMSGCIEVFQYVSIKNGEVDLSIKYVIQKSIIEMGSAFSGEEVDYDDFLGEGEDIFEGLGNISGEMTQINTALEVGMEMRIQGSLDELRELVESDQIPFLPERAGSTFYLNIPGMGSSDSEDDGMAAAFLASAKYRILVDLSGDLSSVSSARLLLDEDADYEDFDETIISATIYGQSMMIEIPMLILFMSDEALQIELY